MFDIQETTKNADCSFTTKLEDQNVIEIGSDVTLSCCLDREYPVQWYKDQCEISMNDKFEFKDELGEHKLIIADIQEDDSGVYSCKCGTTKTSCKLNVAANRFIKQLEDVTITEGQKLILACDLNAECQNLKWYKTNGDISYRTIITDFERADSNAHRYKLEINRVRIEDAGEYICSNENVITTCHVTVKEIKELNIDTSLETTTLLHELSIAREQQEVTEDELNKTAKDVVQKESIIEKKEKEIEKKEKEIEKLRDLLKKKEDTIKRKESELENNAHCIKELESIKKQLESNKQLLAQMKEQNEKLEAEKKHLEGRVSSLESDIKNFIKQQQKISEQLEEGNRQQQKANKEQKELLNEIKAKMEEKSKVCSVL